MRASVLAPRLVRDSLSNLSIKNANFPVGSFSSWPLCECVMY